MEILPIWFGISCILTFCMPNFIHTLRLLENRVPNYVIKDSNAQLECLYDLEGEALYSVKWYKDGNEFYRYMPMGLPKVETFPLPGIDVDLHTSHEANVTLNEVSFQSSGRYRCEISAEAPSFQTVTDTATMIVVVLPEHGNPRIYGARPRYQIGDWVKVNCTAGPSKPAVDLEWVINDKPVSKHNLRTYPLIMDEGAELETITLGLQFRVEAHLFQNGDLRLKCVASLKPFYWRSNEEVIEADRPQKAHVLDASIYTIHSGADPVLGPSTRESFATKFLSMITQTNAAAASSRFSDANVLAFVSQLCLALLVTACGASGHGSTNRSSSNRSNNSNFGITELFRKLISINASKRRREPADCTLSFCTGSKSHNDAQHANNVTLHIRQSNGSNSISSKCFKLHHPSATLNTTPLPQAT